VDQAIFRSDQILRWGLRPASGTVSSSCRLASASPPFDLIFALTRAHPASSGATHAIYSTQADSHFRDCATILFIVDVIRSGVVGSPPKGEADPDEGPERRSLIGKARRGSCSRSHLPAPSSSLLPRCRRLKESGEAGRFNSPPLPTPARAWRTSTCSPPTDVGAGILRAFINFTLDAPSSAQSVAESSWRWSGFRSARSRMSRG